MFLRQDYHIGSDPVCGTAAADLSPQDFLYYDKDGFELCQAEKKFYEASGYPLQDCLLHRCCQQTWFTLRPTAGLILDHALILQRCRYDGAAREQLLSIKPQIPQADWLLNTRTKWGFDFALDAVSEGGTMFEVLHVEYDHRDYERFQSKTLAMEYQIRHQDWAHAAAQVWARRDDWLHLRGFEQNHWKAQFLLGWTRAEYTEKSL